VWLSNIVQTQKGRDAFISALNQFRSKKVEVGEGFAALGAVLWDLLDQCSASNDIHSAKVIMMLSQTFYRRRRPSSSDMMAQAHPHGMLSLRASSDSETSHLASTSATKASGDHTPGEGDLRGTSIDALDGSFDGEAESDDRSGVNSSSQTARTLRDYLKEMLISHTIWRDGSFWEQALWQCMIEQMQTIPYEKAWYDMDGEGRAEAVRRVHSVVFSQVMAITHSMIELGCSKSQTREFLYRMCVVHQLSERQRQQLLSHLLSR
jgi:hypothetical protein